MIRKIVRIENVGSFVACKAAGDVEFRPVTLIVGENARGKTTFAAILRSLASGDPSPVLGRRCLGAPAEPTIEILLTAGVARFAQGAWNGSYPNIEVFDQTFVHDNVYAGDAVDHEHKKNLLTVIVGAAGVQLARRIEELDRQSREQTRILSELKSSIEKYLPSGMKLGSALELETDPDVGQKIVAKETEISMLERAREIAATDALSFLEVLEIPESLSEVLTQTIDSVTNDAEKLVRDHVAQHRVTEPWLSEGLDASGESCPFCGQHVVGLQLLDAFRGYFSQAYGSLKQRVTNVESEILNIFGESRAEKAIAVNDKNAILQNFWSPVVGTAERSETGFAEVFRLVREAALSALATKKSAILEAVSESGDLIAARKALAELNERIRAMNERIRAYNRRITKAKEDTAGRSLADAKRELLLLELNRARHTEPMAALCSDYARATSTKAQIEKEKDLVKADLDGHIDKTFVTHHSKVNELLEDFGATFRITRPVRRYTGGSASAAYGIVINNTEVELGDENTPESQPRFGNTLSASDRLTLALAFFLSSLEHDPTLEQKVVVLDDPFTSQDRTRQWHTQKQIRRLGSRALQVIVLSHHAQFLKPIVEEVEPARLRALQLMRVKNSTTIAPWDPGESGDQFAQEYRKLTLFIDNGAITAKEKQDVARSIRPLIEGRVKMLCPFEFQGSHQFGDVLAAIRNAAPDSVVAQLKPALEDLEELNEFARRYMHGENPGADAEHIDDGELLTYVKKAVRIAQGLPG